MKFYAGRHANTRTEGKFAVARDQEPQSSNAESEQDRFGNDHDRGKRRSIISEGVGAVVLPVAGIRKTSECGTLPSY